ncbi:hypothetical protein IKA92_04075 [bacterium]|nr:hypothetical protein [bacterium]
MTYFELLNKVLLELGLNMLDKFENAYKNEHFRILEALKTANENVCRTLDWDFLKLKVEYDIKKGTSIKLLEDMERVISVKVGGKTLTYDKNFIKNGFKLSGANFWGYGGDGKIEFSPALEDSKIEVVYRSKYFAIGENGERKPNFEFSEDKSVLPDVGKNLLVYDACMLTKPPTAPKYAVWERERKNTMRNLIFSSAISPEIDPAIRLKVR